MLMKRTSVLFDRNANPQELFAAAVYTLLVLVSVFIEVEGVLLGFFDILPDLDYSWNRIADNVVEDEDFRMRLEVLKVPAAAFLAVVAVNQHQVERSLSLHQPLERRLLAVLHFEPDVRIGLAILFDAGAGPDVHANGLLERMEAVQILDGDAEGAAVPNPDFKV
jgi:hypothetical protein